MANTTMIQVTACDNELYILASTGDFSSEICHIKSGYNQPVNYSISPGAILPAGAYTLIMIGINWGQQQAFQIIVTTGGVPTTYTAPANTAVGANWTVAVPITV